MGARISGHGRLDQAIGRRSVRVIIFHSRKGKASGTLLPHMRIKITLIIVLTARVTGVFAIAFAFSLPARLAGDTRAFSFRLFGHVGCTPAPLCDLENALHRCEHKRRWSVPQVDVYKGKRTFPSGEGRPEAPIDDCVYAPIHRGAPRLLLYTLISLSPDA